MIHPFPMTALRSLLFTAVILLPMLGVPSTWVTRASAGPAPLLSGTAIAKAIVKYFGKEGSEEASEYLAKRGGREIAERVSRQAVKQGGEEAAEQVSRLAAKYGPEALAALDNVPAVGPVLAALDELPESQVRAALARLSAGSAGRELAETVGRHGVKALRSELAHPGIGGILVRALGDDGAELAGSLSTDQAVMVARHADDLAALPATQRNGVLAMLRNDTERVVAFMGRFAADNPGKTLFTVATTTVILAEPDRILGGDEVVFDADGNPIVVSKSGLAGRTLSAGGEAIAHVSMNYVRPLFIAAMVFIGTFFTLWMLLKFWHLHQREKLHTAELRGEGLGQPSATLEGNAVQRDP
ncbi:hypothetical protein FYK55_09585 [Roseiconus nitratireducens]|uniref:Uncharacterized protein n=1 Tax=Roseiconus nitratireducens TaxID=2605748 RepID=A0A5M6DDT1_9BACT|nr:hypothetical protein [Roseiconus nitratireducens]KAA5544560.1 hypothetical protein FYK55_09585 [Roseiconus nitratireducens]